MKEKDVVETYESLSDPIFLQDQVPTGSGPRSLMWLGTRRTSSGGTSRNSTPTEPLSDETQTRRHMCLGGDRSPSDDITSTSHLRRRPTGTVGTTCPKVPIDCGSGRRLYGKGPVPDFLWTLLTLDYPIRET